MDALSLVFTFVGVLVTIAVVLGTTLFARKMVNGMLSPLLAQQAENKRLLSVGTPCLARVLHIEQTGTSVAIMGEQSYEIRFQLEITPPASAAYRGGAAPHRAEMVSLVSMLSLAAIQPGALITVRVDPHDPRKMAFESANPPAASPYPGAPTGAPMTPPMPAAYPGAAMGAYPGAAMGAGVGAYPGAAMGPGVGAYPGAAMPGAYPGAASAQGYAPPQAAYPHSPGAPQAAWPQAPQHGNHRAPHPGHPAQGQWPPSR